MLTALEKLGFSSFRPGQQEAVMRILCGEFVGVLTPKPPVLQNVFKDLFMTALM